MINRDEVWVGAKPRYSKDSGFVLTPHCNVRRSLQQVLGLVPSCQVHGAILQLILQNLKVKVTVHPTINLGSIPNPLPSHTPSNHDGPFSKLDCSHSQPITQCSGKSPRYDKPSLKVSELSRMCQLLAQGGDKSHQTTLSH